MNNTGSDNPVEPVESNEAEASTVRRQVPLRIVILGLVAIVFAIVIGSQVIGVLYAIFFPPTMPIPDPVTLVTHTSSDYGTDDWLYTSSKLSACDVLKFYQSKDAQCRVAPMMCDTDTSDLQAPMLQNGQGQNVARCTASQKFSIFALRWEAIIATGATEDQTSQFRLNREIYWTGDVPPNNPPSLNGGFPDFTPESTSAS